MIISNAKLKDGIFDIEIKDGKITKIGKFEKSDIDAQNMCVIPGLIDVHIHGYKGIDSSDGGLYRISDELVREGVTSWAPTLMTDSIENLKKICSNTQNLGKANFLGYHLEGPYLSPQKSGAQNLDYIKAPDFEEYKEIENVALITVAPEIEGGIEFIKRVKNAAVCIGHTMCDYDCAQEAFDSGALCLTHTFNVMPPMLHRAPGPIGAAIVKNAYAQLICDGLHVEKSVVLAAYRMFTSDRLVLISDTIRSAGMPDGEYESGGYKVIVKNSLARLENGNIAGGFISLLGAVKTAVSFGIDFYEAVKMASETPAKMLRLNKGVIKEGYDADLAILDDDLNVITTIVNGQIVYTR